MRSSSWRVSLECFRASGIAIAAAFRVLAAIVLMLTIVSVALTTSANSSTIALDLTGAGILGTDDRPFTVGWAFDVNSAITVMQLGFWDEGSDGLAESHLVRLWNATGTAVLSSATVDNGSAPVPGGIPEGRWLFEDVPPVLLTPGRYVIGADGGFETDESRAQQVISTIPELTFVEPREISPPGFPTTVTALSSPGIFGPTFTIPEPSTLLLAGLGSLGLFAYGWRRRKP